MYYPDQPFHICAYKKSELAHLYNPNVCLKVALQILRRWTAYNLPLLQELEQEGYHIRNRLLSPRQVATIICYLGEPQELNRKNEKLHFVTLQTNFFATAN